MRAAKERALSNEDYRWRGMVRSMASDSRLDRDGAVRLVAAARQLSSSTSERMGRLNTAFDKRFDHGGGRTYEPEEPEAWDNG